MFLKKINKKNKNSDKEYTYYRLVHSYKIGNKIRHQTIMSLGSLSEVSKENHKALADRIENIFDRLKFKHRPFVRKTKLVPQM